VRRSDIDLRGGIPAELATAEARVATAASQESHRSAADRQKQHSKFASVKSHRVSSYQTLSGRSDPDATSAAPSTE